MRSRPAQAHIAFTASENSGQRPLGGAFGHSNEDATHEKGEKAAHEAAENAAAMVSPTP